MKNSFQEQTNVFIDHGLGKRLHGIEVTIVTDVNSDRGSDALKSSIPSIEKPNSLIVERNPLVRVQLIYNVDRGGGKSSVANNCNNNVRKCFEDENSIRLTGDGCLGVWNGSTSLFQI